MDAIVLVKQVPDLSDLRPDAWDEETGTLRRGMLDSILNPLDLHALSLAEKARRLDPKNKNGRIIAVTMGPAQAEEILHDCLSRCADEAVLITDRLLAGADTCATAYTLANAIERIVEYFGLLDQFMIFAGMQSVDGDTAQVPPQVAEHLELDLVAYAEDIDYRDGWLIRRIGLYGPEIIRPKRLPILITAASSKGPVYRSFHRARWAYHYKIPKWSAADLALPPEKIGLSGSRTHVIRIFSPSEVRSAPCRFARDPYELAVELLRLWRTGSSRNKEATCQADTYRLNGRQPTWHGEIWVFAEQHSGTIHQVAFELLGTARRLATPLGEKVGAILLGYNIKAKVKELFAYGADKVYIAEDPILKEFMPIPYKKVLANAVRTYRPQILLFGATPLGRQLAPQVAYATESGLTADCTRLEIGDVERGELKAVAVLKQTRPALGGNIMATIITRNSFCQMATVRPGVMKALQPDFSRLGQTVELEINTSPEDIGFEVVEREPQQQKVRLSDAQVIVSGGRGIGSRDGFLRYLKPLADLLSKILGVRAEIGGSRAAVELGYIERDRQVGQTGQTVRPRLYIAVGISGAIQHLSGVQDAELLVAINKDLHASIFRHADLGIVGEYERTIQKLIEALTNIKPEAISK